MMHGKHIHRLYPRFIPCAWGVNGLTGVDDFRPGGSPRHANRFHGSLAARSNDLCASGSSWWIHTYAGRGTPSSEMRISWIRRNRWALLLAYLAYVGVLALTICYHEPWADEAQAWLIARDAGPVELFTHVLRYEGSPGLWHLLLMGPAKAGLPYWTSHVLAGIIAAGGVFLLLRYSEIPLIPRLLLPFTFFLLYQYAVVARSYVLLPLLLGAIAIVYPDRDRRTLLFALLLCLLANANTHGMLIALALAAIYMVGGWRKWRTMDGLTRRRHIIAMGVFGATILLVVLELLFPADLASPAVWKQDTMARGIAMNALLLGDAIALPRMPWLSIPLFLISCLWFWRCRILSGIPAAYSVTPSVVHKTCSCLARGYSILGVAFRGVDWVWPSRGSSKSRWESSADCRPTLPGSSVLCGRPPGNRVIFHHPI